jgi:hypothetical protein
MEDREMEDRETPGTATGKDCRVLGLAGDGLAPFPSRSAVTFNPG